MKNLDDREYEDFLAFVTTMPEGEELVTVCKDFRDAAAYSDEEMAERLKLSRHYRNKYLEEIGTLLLHHAENADTRLEALLSLAKQQLYARNYEGAEELFNLTMATAEKMERYLPILKLWDLVEDFSIPPKITGMAEEEAERLQDNLAAFEQLMKRFKRAVKEPGVKARRQAIETIRDHPLLLSSEQAFSKRAAYLYWKINALCRINLVDLISAIPFQEGLVQHITAHPWVCEDEEFMKVKELGTLSFLYADTGKVEVFVQLTEEIRRLEIKSLRAKEEKMRQRYPVVIVIALDSGNWEEGEKACLGFLQLLDEKGISYSTQFITENLYWCAYFYITTRDLDAAGKMLIKTRRYSKAEFKRNYFQLTRLLEIVHAIETEDWALAKRLIKNALALKNLEELPGLKEVFLFFDRTAKKIDEEDRATKVDAFINTPMKLKAAVEGQAINRYFDILAWLEAREKERPMAEGFRQRALSQKRLDQP